MADDDKLPDTTKLQERFTQLLQRYLSDDGPEAEAALRMLKQILRKNKFDYNRVQVLVTDKSSLSERWRSLYDELKADYHDMIRRRLDEAKVLNKRDLRQKDEIRRAKQREDKLKAEVAYWKKIASGDWDQPEEPEADGEDED